MDENVGFRLMINRLPEIRSSRLLFERLLELKRLPSVSESRSSRLLFERLLEQWLSATSTILDRAACCLSGYWNYIAPAIVASKIEPLVV